MPYKLEMWWEEGCLHVDCSSTKRVCLERGGERAGRSRFEPRGGVSSEDSCSQRRGTFKKVATGLSVRQERPQWRRGRRVSSNLLWPLGIPGKKFV